MSSAGPVIGQGTGQTVHSSGNPDRPYDPVNLSARKFWHGTMRDREGAFRTLRAERPISWQPPFEEQLVEDPDDYGYWAITTHRHLVEVTRRPADFLSGPGILMENWPAEIVEAAQSILGMDPPRHTQLRKLVSSAFTPRQMRRIEDRITANATRCVDNLLAKARVSDGGWVDFVAECGALVPMHNFSDMMGLPEGVRQQAAHQMMLLHAYHDAEFNGESKDETLEIMRRALEYMHRLSAETVADRRRDPQPDLFTALAQAQVDGERLTDYEIASFFVLLTIAGNDTTRNSLAHGLRALSEFPAQRQWLLADLAGRLPGAMEEMFRWATPVMTFRRTASRDCELDGHLINKGDKLVMFYSSANRDETVFTDPDLLDLSRNPNPHITFGGGGIHHCLGNQLARLQVKTLLSELLTRCPDIAFEEPELTPHHFFYIAKRIRCNPLGANRG